MILFFPKVWVDINYQQKISFVNTGKKKNDKKIRGALKEIRCRAFVSAAVLARWLTAAGGISVVFYLGQEKRQKDSGMICILLPVTLLVLILLIQLFAFFPDG